jgi:hypothetical protein
MLANYFITIATFVAISNAENVGWKSYFVENPTEFHDIPLSWESGNQTSVPSWLSGIYVRNGPAQVLISLLNILSIKVLTLTFGQYDYQLNFFNNILSLFLKNGIDFLHAFVVMISAFEFLSNSLKNPIIGIN